MYIIGPYFFKGLTSTLDAVKVDQAVHKAIRFSNGSSLIQFESANVERTLYSSALDACSFDKFYQVFHYPNNKKACIRDEAIMLSLICITIHCFVVGVKML